MEISTAKAADDQFFALTPERVLDAVENMGFRCSGRCTALNSMENRVYEVEVEIANGSQITSPSDRFRVVKFYRPGRWTREQILEEHDFILALESQELPVIAPLRNENGETVLEISELGVFGALFPKRGGRIEPELQDTQLERLGRLLARMHSIGAASAAQHRLSLTPSTYGRDNKEFLLREKLIPTDYAHAYEQLVDAICAELDQIWNLRLHQRIHGDCHRGNILWQGDNPLLLDFDDMVMGPPVQDIWLILPGRDSEAMRQRDVLLDAYEQMRHFDYSSWRIVEGLRALRFIHFSAWIGRRWQDPSFQRAFPQFGSLPYWREQLADLNEQLELLRNSNTSSYSLV